MFNRKEYDKQYYLKNISKLKKYKKQYRKDNYEKIKEHLKQYHKDNPGKYKEYWEKNYIKNKEKILKYYKQYRLKNREKISKNTKQYYKDNSEKIKECHKKYYIKNKKSKNEWAKRYRKIKYKTNIKFNLNVKMSIAINLSLKNNKNGRHWEDLVGYNLNDLIKRLKQTMPKDCNWQDYLNGGLHIDHKIPISAFHFSKLEHIDFKRCWALNNLQLLPAKENRIKHDKLYKPFQPALKLEVIL
ncbi:hypothetical protein ES708_28884 [subsurface metagenome]